MGGLRTLVVVWVGLLAAASPARAYDLAQAPDPVRFFAACSGRLSAQMEFQWLMQDPAADVTEAQRAAMLDILDALGAADRGREVYGLRINAKAAFGALLNRATFNDDAEDAAWAQATARAELQACTALLLS